MLQVCENCLYNIKISLKISKRFLYYYIRYVNVISCPLIVVGEILLYYLTIKNNPILLKNSTV